MWEKLKISLNSKSLSQHNSKPNMSEVGHGALMPLLYFFSKHVYIKLIQHGQCVL